MFDDVVRFWFDRGADGLRIDVAHGLFKAAGLPDLDHPATAEPMRLRANPLACNQQEVHDVYRRWRRIADGYEQPRVLVGEANLPAADAASYTRPDELHQVFAFAFLAAPWDAGAWHQAAAELLAVSADSSTTTTWVVENHDVVRAPTRYGAAVRVAGGGRGRRSSRCSGSRARRTSTRGRSSVCPRWTCRRTGARTPRGPATASPVTGAVSRSRGRGTALGPWVLGRPRAGARGCRCRTAGGTVRSRRRSWTTARPWHSVAVRCASVPTCTATAWCQPRTRWPGSAAPTGGCSRAAANAPWRASCSRWATRRCRCPRERCCSPAARSPRQAPCPRTPLPGRAPTSTLTAARDRRALCARGRAPRALPGPPRAAEPDSLSRRRAARRGRCRAAVAPQRRR